jgi:hypothetical protein
MTNRRSAGQQPPVAQERLNKTTKQVSIEFIALLHQEQSKKLCNPVDYRYPFWRIVH